MKRNLTLLCLGLAAVFSLAACSDSAAPTVTPSPSAGMEVPDGQDGLGNATGGYYENEGPQSRSYSSADMGLESPPEAYGYSGGNAMADADYYAGADGQVISHGGSGSWAENALEEAGRAVEDAANGIGSAVRGIMGDSGDASRDTREWTDPTDRGTTRGMEGVGRGAMEAVR